MTIGERITQIMKSQKITQKEFSEKIGVGQSTISSWKSGEKQPLSTYLITIAEVLNVSVYYLLTGIEENDEIITIEEKKHLEQYRKLSEKDKTEINGIIELKLKNVTIETKVINSKVG